jgi:hypothetical protein
MSEVDGNKLELYIQFPEEPLHVAIAVHDDDPFSSIEECKQFITDTEDVGSTFKVVDREGKIYYMGVVTADGIEEVTVDSIRRG